MFCPKCGSETVDGARFCRTCGQDVAFVQEAMTGRLPAVATSSSVAAYDPKAAEKMGKMLEGSIRHASIGVAFAVIAACVIAFAPAGFTYGFWFLLPGFMMIGKGVSEFMHYKALGGLNAAALPQQVAPAPTPRELAAPSFTESVAPPSVTEQTTRHLDRER